MDRAARNDADLIRRLAAENETLRETVRQLEARWLVALRFDLPGVGLSPSEQGMLALLYGSRSVVTPAALAAARRARDRNCAADLALVSARVMVSRLRGKLRRLDIRIHGVWGTGYRLDADSRARLAALIEGGAA